MKRSKDGRFLPRTGEDTLPPKPAQNARDEHGRWIKSERVQSSKPYSRAVRELMDAKEGGLPEGWDHTRLTEAQVLAMTHFAQAKGGNVQVGMMIVDRAEGKVPQAAEDREAALAAGTGIKMLAELLGLRDLGNVQDAEIVPQLPPGKDADGPEVTSEDQETETTT